ncbi:MAG: hypothetical protein PHD45_10375 [Bacteroidales bacterium]|nr:hypothetical protein [Bacteroidales bacterium]
MIHGREIDFEEYVNLLRKGSVHFYNDYEDIVYKAIIDINAGKVRYFAKKIGRGREYEVFKETSNVLMDTLQQIILITEEDYNKA